MGSRPWQVSAERRGDRSPAEGPRAAGLGEVRQFVYRPPVPVVALAAHWGTFFATLVVMGFLMRWYIPVLEDWGAEIPIWLWPLVRLGAAFEAGGGWGMLAAGLVATFFATVVWVSALVMQRTGIGGGNGWLVFLGLEGLLVLSAGLAVIVPMASMAEATT